MELPAASPVLDYHPPARRRLNPLLLAYAVAALMISIGSALAVFGLLSDGTTRHDEPAGFAAFGVWLLLSGIFTMAAVIWLRFTPRA